VATPAELRAQSGLIANIFTDAAVARAEAGDVNTAVACQWVGDVHRVAAALWGRAGTHPDPYPQFFRLAEQVLVAADRVTSDDGAPALMLITDLRSAFIRACSALSVQLVFPQATHLVGLDGPVDLARMRDQLLDGRTAAEFVTDRMTGAQQTAGVPALRLSVDAYLVDVADRTGDHLMLTAAARMVALAAAAPANPTDLTGLVAATRRVLGPVEWIRIQPYLRRAGLPALA